MMNAVLTLDPGGEDATMNAEMNAMNVEMNEMNAVLTFDPGGEDAKSNQRSHIPDDDMTKKNIRLLVSATHLPPTVRVQGTIPTHTTITTTDAPFPTMPTIPFNAHVFHLLSTIHIIAIISAILISPVISPPTSPGFPTCTTSPPLHLRAHGVPPTGHDIEFDWLRPRIPSLGGLSLQPTIA